MERRRWLPRLRLLEMRLGVAESIAPKWHPCSAHVRGNAKPPGIRKREVPAARLHRTSYAQDGGVRESVNWATRNQMLERLAVEKLHGDKSAAFVLPNFVNCADVG